MSLRFTNQVLYAGIYILPLVNLPLLWWLEKQFFQPKLAMATFHVSKLQISGLWTLRVLIQIRKARIQMDLSKNKYNRFPGEETTNYIPHISSRKKEGM